MAEDSVVALPRPGASITDDPLLAVPRDGAKRMLMQAVEAEVEAFLATHAELADEQGRRRLVRNGHAPERQIETGIGPLAVRRPKLRDRGGAGSGEPIRFTSAILPAYLRRTKNLEEVLPWLYLKGVSTGQFGEALAALLGPDAPGLSASTVRRLTESWQEEHARWQKRDLSAGYAQVWCTGSGGGLLLVGLNGLAVAEAHAIDDLGEPLRTIQPAPVPLGRLGELENHRQRGLA